MSEDTASRGADAAADAELAYLREVNARPIPARWLGYAKLSGPGFIQSAITLGASTATSCFYLGWKFGYEMLWVQILGMVMGVVMFAAVTRPALFRSESIYRAMGRCIDPSLAIAWALASIVASMVWCINQYATAVSCLVDAGQATGILSAPDGASGGSKTASWVLGLAILAISVPLTFAYARGKGRGIRIYERFLKAAILFMVICFAVVAWKTGIRWGDVAAGLVPNPTRLLELDAKDLTVILGALGCTVGINMTFLFPLTLRDRRWGREHLGLARFDLITGMLLPFSVISSFVVIASANRLHGAAEQPAGPAQVAAQLFGAEGLGVSDTFGRVLFDLGVATMPLSTITILMLISGLALCEMLRVPHDSKWFKIGALLPTVGIAGVGYGAPFWLGPLISSFALILLPIAYAGFLVLHNSRAFLGKDGVEGGRRKAWTAAMLVVLAITLAGAYLKLKDNIEYAKWIIGFLALLGLPTIVDVLRSYNRKTFDR